MSDDIDKREHSLKPEVDDMTDYQVLNSSGRAGVAEEAHESAPPITAEDIASATTGEPSNAKPPEVIEYEADYNDGADINPVDGEGRTNA